MSSTQSVAGSSSVREVPTSIPGDGFLGFFFFPDLDCITRHFVSLVSSLYIYCRVFKHQIIYGLLLDHHAYVHGTFHSSPVSTW